MSTEIPLGQRENQQLEFKSKEVLRYLASVGKAVVAMLNSDGGDLWIGLGESNGVVVSIEPIQDVDREIGRLRDHFSDSIEPAPSPREIEIEPVNAPGAGMVLRLRLRPATDVGPRALREGAARLFILRVGDRVRPMSHAEIASRFAGKGTGVEIGSEANRKVLDARDKWLSKGRVLWLRLQPFKDLKITFRPEENFRKYFAEPKATGNRASGWNFVNPYARINPERGALVHKDEGHELRIFPDGGVEFTVPLENLYWKSATGRPEADGKEIWPYCLLEYPISVFRLASTIYRERVLEKICPVLADLALFGLRGWTLRPYSPRSFRYNKLQNPKPFGEENLLLLKPLTFRPNEILEEPDRCGFRLVEQVYESFDYWEDRMPAEFDRQTGKLVFPND